MMPWIAPIRDNLEHLFGDRSALDMQLEQGVIEIEAMTYIRGRSISNAFMVVDEAQNLTPHELKTIITRVGHGTKLVLTGDIQQIDNSYVDAVSNGLTYAVEKFKEYEMSGHISLIKGERSKLATLASEIL
jgi:PhoH-like ATPase